MNLHGIVSGAISAVNPPTIATLLVSTGYTTAADGTQTPSYAAPVQVMAQVQAETFRDLTQLDSLNLQGTRRVMYLYGEVDGIIRVSSKGGDLVVIASGVHAGTWLTALVIEQWPDWVKIAATLQNGS